MPTSPSPPVRAPEPGACTPDAAGAASSDGPEDVRRRTRVAILATVGIYAVYGALDHTVPSIAGLVLIVGFLFLPMWLLRREGDRVERWELGPDVPIPPWHAGAARTAALVAAAVLVPFAFIALFFFQRVCTGDLTLLAPVLAVESLTPAAGSLERFFAAECRGHPGTLLPGAFRLPSDWYAWWGLAALYFVAIEIFVVALPEEVFHRAYLMNVLEERLPARVRVLGVPFGAAVLGSSAVFALGHLVGRSGTDRLGTFFPSLLFSWVYRRTGSLWAPVLLHAAANLLMQILRASTFAR